MQVMGTSKLLHASSPSHNTNATKKKNNGAGNFPNFRRTLILYYEVNDMRVHVPLPLASVLEV